MRFRLKCETLPCYAVREQLSSFENFVRLVPFVKIEGGFEQKTASLLYVPAWHSTCARLHDEALGTQEADDVCASAAKFDQSTALTRTPLDTCNPQLWTTAEGRLDGVGGRV